MKRKMRRNFNSNFKSKVVLEALKEQLTLSEIASKYEIHANQISLWKKQFLDNMETVFENPKVSGALEKGDLEKDELYRTVGQLKMENDWLKKKSEQVFGKGWEAKFNR